MTNTEFLDFFSDLFIERLNNEWKHEDIIDISGFDTWGTSCNCENCQKLGNGSDMALHMLSYLRNKINEALESGRLKKDVCHVRRKSMTDSKKSPFEKLYIPLSNADLYLKRIGFYQSAEPTLECLKKLIKCHLMNVPFENLDIFYKHLEPSLETDALFEKIVANKRGGYCFELNGLFCKLLEKVGYNCFGAICRIVLGFDYPMPYTHRINIVNIADEFYFCDVGYGGPCPDEPLKIEYDKIISTESGKKFCFKKEGGEIALYVALGGEMKRLMVFSITPDDLVDFIPLNAFCAHSPYEPFVHKVMVSLLTETGKYSIDGDILRIKENETVTETKLLNDEDVEKALKKWFDIEFKI